MSDHTVESGADLCTPDRVEDIQSHQSTTYGGRQHRGKAELFAMAVMLVASAGFVSGILVASFPLEHADLNRVFSPEHVQLFAMVDNSRARLAYSAWLVSLACLCQMAAIFPRRSGASGRSPAGIFQSISERIPGIVGYCPSCRRDGRQVWSTGTVRSHRIRAATDVAISLASVSSLHRINVGRWLVVNARRENRNLDLAPTLCGWLGGSRAASTCLDRQRSPSQIGLKLITA